MIRSADEFLRLLRSLDSADRTRARQEEASEEVWLEVMKREPELTESVALNKKLPFSVLELLAQDSNPRVRYAVAMKGKIGPDLLLKFSSDTDDRIRFLVATHRNTDLEVLRRLAQDDKAHVGKAARSQLSERWKKSLE